MGILIYGYFSPLNTALLMTIIEFSILYIANINCVVVLLVRVGDSFNMMKILLVIAIVLYQWLVIPIFKYCLYMDNCSFNMAILFTVI